ncbi:hypothetical protein DFH09DRAFT_1077552 [Mycena vulgaris]|nr:hypothetical protein DFH09DRAFT_1077552 [Mycena vulgaris]
MPKDLYILRGAHLHYRTISKEPFNHTDPTNGGSFAQVRGYNEALHQGIASSKWALKKGSKSLTWSLWNKQEAKQDLEKIEHFKSLLNMWLTLDICRDTSQQQSKSHEDILLAVRAFSQPPKAGHDSEYNLLQLANESMKSRIVTMMSHAVFGMTTLVCLMISMIYFFLAPQNNMEQRAPADAVVSMLIMITQRVEDCAFMPTFQLIIMNFRGFYSLALIPGPRSLVVNYPGNESQHRNVGVASAYLNHKETESQTPQNVLSGLWRQNPSQLQSMHFTGIIVYFIVDALDEYPEEQHSILLKQIDHAWARSKPDEIQHLEIHATEMISLNMHIQTHPELHKEVESKIISNAQEMFLLAKLHIDALSTKHTIKAVHEASEKLPKDLKNTYDDAMQQIDNQGKEDRQLAQLALT